MQENNNNRYTAIGHGQSQVQIWKKLMQKNSMIATRPQFYRATLQCPQNTGYSGSRDLFNFW